MLHSAGCASPSQRCVRTHEVLNKSGKEWGRERVRVKVWQGLCRGVASKHVKPAPRHSDMCKRVVVVYFRICCCCGTFGFLYVFKIFIFSALLLLFVDFFLLKKGACLPGSSARAKKRTSENITTTKNDACHCINNG